MYLVRIRSRAEFAWQARRLVDSDSEARWRWRHASGRRQCSANTLGCSRRDGNQNGVSRFDRVCCMREQYESGVAAFWQGACLAFRRPGVRLFGQLSRYVQLEWLDEAVLLEADTRRKRRICFSRDWGWRCGGACGGADRKTAGRGHTKATVQDVV